MLSRRMNFSIESGDFETGCSVALQYFSHDQNLILVESNLPANIFLRTGNFQDRPSLVRRL